MLELRLLRIQVQGRINGRANARPIDSSIYIYMLDALGISIWDRSFLQILNRNVHLETYLKSNKLSLKCAVLQILSVSQRPGPGREAQSQLPSPGPQTKKNNKKHKNDKKQTKETIQGN